MRQIALSDAYDAKLKTLVTDFGQTREDLVERLIDEEVARQAGAANGDAPTSAAAANEADVAMTLKPAAPGSLAHTKPLTVTIDGIDLHKPKWNGLRERAHVLALKKLGSLAELKKVSDANLRSGKYEQDGYKYLPEAGFSIQGVDANASWADTFKLVKELKMPVRVEFLWREKEGAAHPGKIGVIEWPGEKGQSA